MEGDSFVYSLRCSNPLPTSNDGYFVLQTFMAEKTKIEYITCTSELPLSSDFLGRGGNLVSASFTKLMVAGDVDMYSGRKVYKPEFIEESVLENI